MSAKRSGVALVTGGSRGIGRAVALALAERQAGTVIVNYLENERAAASAQEEIATRGAESLLVRANLASPSEIDRLVGEVRAKFDCIDTFVHCAALGAFKSTLETKANQWDLTMNVNARSFLLCAQQIAPMMRGGAMVAVSSLGSGRVIPRYGAMGPTKAALESLVRYLAVELAPRGIRVNAVSTGMTTDTGVAEMDAAREMLRIVESRTPAGRLGTPKDITDVILFLTDPASRWICGQCLVADGGYSLW